MANAVANASPGLLLEGFGFIQSAAFDELALAAAGNQLSWATCAAISQPKDPLVVIVDIAFDPSNHRL